MEENIERTCKLKVKENMECEMRKREKEMTLCTANAHHVVKVRVRIKEEYKEKCCNTPIFKTRDNKELIKVLGYHLGIRKPLKINKRE